MKKNKKKLTRNIGIIFLILLVFFSISIISSGGWDNFKLKATRYWGFLTINNNPLLSDYDKDIKESTSQIEPRIDLADLRSGGPPKDGIPSIDNPKFDTVQSTSFQDDEIIVGVYYKEEARAYPYSILNWHEIVNDNFNGTNVVVTLCPLCDTNPVFIGEINGTQTTFGVSGKLFNSCLVMYDRLTDTLWSQPWGIGIVGENTNQVLEKIVSHKTTLGEWKKLHPQTKILSTDTGYKRDYFRYPYGTYYTDNNLIFPARNQNRLDTHPKEIISYIWEHDNLIPTNIFSGDSKKIVHSYIREEKEKEIKFNNKTITAKWDEELNTVRFFDYKQNEIVSSTAFAFVYPAYFE